MPRPRKWRKVCCLPQSSRFGPLGVQTEEIDFVSMTVDEYETIRLIDLEGFNQEECANQMQIARTTAQRIYNDARKKLADTLVNNKSLIIEGGDYALCDGKERSCRCGGCPRHKMYPFKEKQKELLKEKKEEKGVTQ